MATWVELSQESLRAAGLALRSECYRSSVSRAYYAAFAAVVSMLDEKGVKFTKGRYGPSHQKVPQMIKKHMPGLAIHRRAKLLAAMNLLYKLRLDADYKPPRTVDLGSARQSLISATLVLGLLGVRA